MAACVSSTGDVAEAEAAYRRALAIVPESPDALIGLAAALADGGDLDEAERTLERAIASQPRYAAAHTSSTASSCSRQGRPRDAIAPFQRATVLEPDNPGGFNNLGAAYLYAGDFDQAAEAFARSLAIEPRRTSYSNTGTGYYYQWPVSTKRREMFRKATELAPSDHRLWGNLADALLFGGRRGRSRRGLRRAPSSSRRAELAVNPRHADQPGAGGVLFHPAPERGPGPTVHRERPGRRGQRQRSALLRGTGPSSGLGDEAGAIRHVRRARELGYPEVFLKSAPELGDIRNKI